MTSLSLAVMLATAVTQDRPVESFHALSVGGGLHVTVKKGKAPGLKLSGDPEVLAKYESFVKDGTLFVRPKKGVSIHSRTDTQVDVTASAALDGIEASGGVSLRGNGLAGAKCSLDLSGGVELDLQSIACESLALEASGGASVKLAGAAKSLDLDLSGGVELETRALSVSAAKVKASGGVDGAIAVADQLSADLSGAANLKVKGHPKMTRAETSGASDLSFE